MCNRTLSLPPAALVISVLLTTTPLLAQTIHFDMPPTAVATPVQPGVSSIVAGQALQVPLRLSSMVSGSQVPEIDRWMIRVVPRDPSWRVLETSPGTETASHYATALQVKLTDESTRSAGVNADVAQPVLGRAHAGSEVAEKQTESVEFDRAAPLHAVTAAGTIQRGRGAFFQLRWMANQVLEGEKQLAVTFDVPPTMRSGLLDVTVIAHGRPGQSQPWSDLPGRSDSKLASKPIGHARFVIAVHRDGDETAWELARQLASAEATLRDLAAEISAKSSIHSIPTLIRHVAAKLDLESQPTDNDWVERMVDGTADPYTDQVIRKLPTETRIAILDYNDLRREFLSL